MKRTIAIIITGAAVAGFFMWGRMSASQNGSGEPKKFDPLKFYAITVDYDLTYEQMLAASKLISVSGDATRQFVSMPGSGKLTFECKLVRFKDDLSINEALFLISKRGDHDGWKPAKIEHLLAFAATHSKEKLECEIIGLGGLINVRELDAKRSFTPSNNFTNWVLMPILSEVAYGRALDLEPRDPDWTIERKQYNPLFLEVREIARK